MSKLASYLEQARVSQADFAAALGVKQPTVSRLVNGVQRPSLDLAIAIERVTRGAVPFTSWASEQREGDAA